MSSPDKIDLLKKAQELGFRTYLYYVATENPKINISRINYRVSSGGHSVPKDRIISRYYRSLDLLRNAVKYTNRAYIFDNSNQQQILLAEITEGSEMSLKVDQVPDWFKKSLLEK